MYPSIIFLDAFARSIYCISILSLLYDHPKDVSQSPNHLNLLALSSNDLERTRKDVLLVTQEDLTLLTANAVFP